MYYMLSWFSRSVQCTICYRGFHEVRTLPLKNPNGIFQWKSVRGDPLTPDKFVPHLYFAKAKLKAKAIWRYIIFQLKT